MTIRRSAIQTLALGCLIMSPAAFAQSPVSEKAPKSSGRLVANVLQDEVDTLPADNTGFFTAARKVKLKLDLLAAMQDEQAELSDALVTVVRPDGSSDKFTPDADGMVTIDDVQPGAHAVVASAERVHGTMLYHFDKQPGAGADTMSLDNEPSPVQMTLLRIRESELRSAIDRVRDVDAGSASVANNITAGDRFNYRVGLSAGGTLQGQVILATRQAISPAGVDVSVFFNGQKVASTTSDQRGFFQVSGLRSGVHGLIASGPVGYSAFAFDANLPTEVAASGAGSSTLVSKLNQAGDTLPVVLVPPQMVQPVVQAITTYYPRINRTNDDELGAPLALPGSPIAPPVAGFSPTPGGFGGGGLSGGGGGLSGGGGGLAGAGGLGGLGGLAGLGAVGAAVAVSTSDDDNAPIALPPVASPSLPTN